MSDSSQSAPQFRVPRFASLAIACFALIGIGVSLAIAAYTLALLFCLSLACSAVFIAIVDNDMADEAERATTMPQFDAAEIDP